MTSEGTENVTLTALIVVGVLAFTFILVFGIGWANKSTTQTNNQASVARIRACEKLPVGKVEACLNPGPSRLDMANSCNNAANYADNNSQAFNWAQCMNAEEAKR